MGGDISFRSEVNRGSSFWFHIPLQIDGGAGNAPADYPHLNNKRMAFVEHNPAAAQATLNILAATPLAVSFSPTLEQLPPEQFDYLLIGKPVTQRVSLIDIKRELALAARDRKSTRLNSSHTV